MITLIKLLIIEELAILIKQNANNKGAQSSHVIETHMPGQQHTQSMPGHDVLKKQPVGNGRCGRPGRKVLLGTSTRRDPTLLHQTKTQNLRIITSKYIIIDMFSYYRYYHRLQIKKPYCYIG
jgi:hypothetical protein